MTDAEIQRIFKEMVEMFGDDLPNPEQEPVRFRYYIKLYNYEKKLQNESTKTV
jgi:hypothetical protein